MALEPESPQLEQVGNRPGGRLPPVLIGLAALFIVVALVKPWPAGLLEHPGSTSHPRYPLPAASATQNAGPVGVFFRQCYSASTWRLTALQNNGDLRVRTVWPAAVSFSATLRPDTGAPRLYAANLEGIGFCVPGDEQASSATRAARAAAVSVWRHDSFGRVVPVVGTSVIDPVLAGEGEVYLAPPAQLAAEGGWPVGDYFFEVSAPRAGSSAAWLGLRVLPAPIPDDPQPSTSPGGIPGALTVVPAAVAR